MASNVDFVQYIVDQCSGAGDITVKKMMGDYCVYCDGVIFGLVCDNNLYIKPTGQGAERLKEVVTRSPYPGAKEHFLITDVDDRDYLTAIIKATIPALPKPKSKRNPMLLAVLLAAALLFSCSKPSQEDPQDKPSPSVSVTSISLSKTDITLVEGGEETIVATVKPDNASDKSVVWESSDVKVASVSNEGKVSAIAEGTVIITAKSGNISATCKVKVDAKPMEISGLEALHSAAFRVDKQVDLIQDLSVTRGGVITRILVKEDGIETELEGQVYVPEYPVESLAITFIAESPDGKQNAMATVEGLTVLPLEYNPVNLAPTNLGKNWDDWKKTVTAGNRQWYEYYETVGLLQTKKVLEQLDLMAPEGRREKLEHIIIVGESEDPTGDHPYIEGVWETAPGKVHKYSQHSDILTEKIKTAENAPNKGIAQSYSGKILWVSIGNWYAALQYSKERSDTKIIFFTANDWVGGIGAEYNPKGTEEGDALQELVNSPNAFVIASIGNVDQLRDYGLECNLAWIERGQYGTSSIQGKHSFAAIGGNLTETKFHDYSVDPLTRSVLPIGYEQKNLKISSGGYPAHEGDLLASQGNEASSWPTAELAATMWNIMALDPDMSFDDLMDLINTYKILIPASHNGEKIQDFDTPDQKEICRQICLPKVPEGLATDGCTELPRESKYPAVLWTGPGVEYYSIDGQWKSLTAEDFQDGRDIFETATNTTFRFNPVLWKKQGGKGTVSLKVMAITTDGETIPEVEREVTFNM
ncbi:MAG: Ig-like domain-containing protein [Bacteroidales bacterium]|nr:Ig-like domain-containing protein [Bacteroidales bacterium]